MFWGLLVAALGSLLLHTRGGLFINGFTDPKIVVMVSAVIAAWYWRTGRQRTPSLYHAAIGYMLALAPSMVNTKNLMLSIFGYPGVYSGGVLTAGLCASGAVLSDRLPDQKRETIRKVILACGTAIAILLIAQKFGRDPFRFPLPGGKAVGLYGSAIDSGALMVTLLGVHLNPLYLGGVWATGTRGAWLGAVVSMVPRRFRAYAFVLATRPAWPTPSWAMALPTPTAGPSGPGHP
jgi:hypothetical protein